MNKVKRLCAVLRKLEGLSTRQRIRRVQRLWRFAVTPKHPQQVMAVLLIFAMTGVHIRILK